ncbi:MAG: SMC-Scp complex subunit ScpB [Woeseiaceae bacterium]|jgi:segregation and condensation protein B|nr:SMC-Scp complex subunit ScpB [Woeseiaceae bacterium]
MDQTEIKYFIEAALLAAGRPLSADQLQDLFDGRSAPDKAEIRNAVVELVEEYEPRGITIGEVASGYRIQVKATMADRLQKLWEERPPRYSRALFETLALVAYRQPITRGEIEDIRGVSVSSNIVRTLMERDWVRVVGHRDVPGRPAMFGTTRTFLDYFGLKKLDDLPPLADLADWESLRVQLNLPEVEDRGEVEVAGESSADAGEVADVGGGIDAIHVESAESAGAEPEADEIEEADAVEAGDGARTSEAETEAVDDDEDLPVLTERADSGSGDDTEELVVSEWPDPNDDAEVATLETRDGKDRDASAGGG